MTRIFTLLLFIGLAWGQSTTIAVLDFEGQGVSQSETSTLTDRLRNEMFKTGTYIVLERGKMDEVLKEQGFQQTGCITSECAVEVGNMLGVQQMIGGSIGKVGNIYTVSARVIDVQTGEVLKSANYDHIGDIGQLLLKGMRQLAYDLSGKDLPYKQKPDVKAKPLPTLDYEVQRKNVDISEKNHSIGLGLVTNKSMNILQYTYDLKISDNFSIFAFLGFINILGGGLAWQQNYNENGFMVGLSGGIDFIEDPFNSFLVSYQWRLYESQDFLSLGICYYILYPQNVIDLTSQELIFPIISWERRFGN